MRNSITFAFILCTAFSNFVFAAHASKPGQYEAALKILIGDRYSMASGCGRDGASCTFSSDCCNNNCNANNVCGSDAFCKGVGASCNFDDDCCTNICDSGTCSRSRRGQCKATGERCTFSSDCCDNNCNAYNICGTDAFCKGRGDICNFNSDCCSNYCTDNKCQ